MNSVKAMNFPESKGGPGCCSVTRGRGGKAGRA